MPINIETYERREDGSTACARVTRIYRDATNAPRCTVESPPGKAVEDRVATPQEVQDLLAEERLAAVASAVARLKALDPAAIPAPYGQLIGDILTAMGIR
jgi:hypothetical protein